MDKQDLPLFALEIIIDNINDPFKQFETLYTLRSLNKYLYNIVNQKLQVLDKATRTLQRLYSSPKRFACYEFYDLEPRMRSDYGNPKRCFYVRVNGRWFYLRGNASFSVYPIDGFEGEDDPDNYFYYRGPMSRKEFRELNLLDSDSASELQTYLKNDENIKYLLIIYI